MKTFRIEYRETILYEFYVDAESEDEVPEAFTRMVDNHEIGFDAGEVVDGDIHYIEEVGKA